MPLLSPRSVMIANLYSVCLDSPANATPAPLHLSSTRTMATPTHGLLANHPADMDMEGTPVLEWMGGLQGVDSGVRRRIKSTLVWLQLP